MVRPFSRSLFGLALLSLRRVSPSPLLHSLRRCALLHLRLHPVLSHSLRVQIRQSPSSLSLSVALCLCVSVALCWRVRLGNQVRSHRSVSYPMADARI
jgi:hypothetical protein